MNDRDRLLSLRAVAIRLSKFKRDNETPNTRAVDYLITEGRLKAVWEGNRKKIRPVDLAEYIDNLPEVKE